MRANAVLSPRPRRGFTLVEMVIVITIILILISITAKAAPMHIRGPALNGLNS